MADFNTLLMVAIVAMVLGVCHFVQGEARAEAQAVQRAGPEDRDKCAFNPNTPIRIVTKHYNNVYFGISANETWELYNDNNHNRVKRNASNYARVPDDLDAGFTIVWPWQWGWTKSTYLFKGSEYWLIINDVPQKGYPSPIKGNWGSIEEVDATLMVQRRLNKPRLYMFKGSQYWEYDTKNDKVKDGYPRNISSFWRGLPNDLNGAMEGTAEDHYFLKDGQYYKLFLGKQAGSVEKVETPFAWCYPKMPKKVPAKGSVG